MNPARGGRRITLIAPARHPIREPYAGGMEAFCHTLVRAVRASAQARAVILPQERPFAEQRATASLLDTAGLAVVAHDFPGPGAWPGLLGQAQSLDSNWHRWQTAGAASRAASRAAEVIRKVTEL
ncbi:hypothetical protein [Corynebacterium hylobatis]|uniref:hypothetical protein n=1 Tax=Corynebacterium hylobatis TaxID=1859290 RepID=UPI0019D2453C|nr:hypothetical protein [Corynebacterium hylobatis]